MIDCPFKMSTKRGKLRSLRYDDARITCFPITPGIARNLNSGEKKTDERNTTFQNSSPMSLKGFNAHVRGFLKSMDLEVHRKTGTETLLRICRSQRRESQDFFFQTTATNSFFFFFLKTTFYATYVSQVRFLKGIERKHRQMAVPVRLVVC